MGFGQRGIRDEVKINRLPLRIPTRGLLVDLREESPSCPFYKGGASNGGILTQIHKLIQPQGKILMIPCRKMIPCRNMYSPLSLFSSALLLLSSISSASVDTKPQTLVVDTFSVTKRQQSTLWMEASRNDISMFSVKQENQNSFTRIFTKGGCTSLGKLFRFSAQQYPHLSWKWRINQLPDGGNETRKDKHDSGASVYIVFKGNFKLNNILKYVWSSSLQVGTVISSPYNKNAKIIVLRSGNEETGNGFRTCRHQSRLQASLR